MIALLSCSYHICGYWPRLGKNTITNLVFAHVVCSVLLGFHVLPVLLRIFFLLCRGVSWQHLDPALLAALVLYAILDVSGHVLAAPVSALGG